MGIALHFTGKLRKPEDVEGLIEEVVDIAETLGWPHRTLRSDLVGVSVDPHPDCESLMLFFDARGAIRNPVLETDGHFCKTQFAPASVHVAIVKLLRHLGQRWFDTFEVVDEGGYWETGDLEELERRRQQIERGLKQATQRLNEAAPKHPEESDDDVAARIERVLTAHEGKPIELTEDEHRRVLGPGGPDPEEAAGWDVPQWIEYFRRHDEGKSPLLKEMKGRPETEKSLREAVRRAEEEDRKDEEAMFKYLARTEREMREGAKDEDPDAEPEAPAPDWSASLPQFDAEDEEDEEREDRDDDLQRLGREFMRQFYGRLRGRRGRPHPAVRYVLALLSSTLVGVRMGGWWARQCGTETPITARRTLAAERFHTIARLLRSFPKLKVDDLAAGAEKVARAFEDSVQGT